MTAHYDGVGAAANVFGCRSLHDWEACMLYEAGYMAPVDMCYPGGNWRFSASGISISPVPRGVERRAAILRHWDGLPAERQANSQWHPDNDATCDGFFHTRRERELVDYDGDCIPSMAKNAAARRLWCGALGRTLAVVLDNIEVGNEPPLGYSQPSVSWYLHGICHRRWLRRGVERCD
jgi:hypothetical protein